MEQFSEFGWIIQVAPIAQAVFGGTLTLFRLIARKTAKRRALRLPHGLTSFEQVRTLAVWAMRNNPCAVQLRSQPQDLRTDCEGWEHWEVWWQVCGIV